MDLAIRLGRLEEIPLCVRLACDSFAYTKEEQREIARIWQELVMEDAARFEVMEDHDAPIDERIIFFGVIAFFHESFRDEMIEGQSPFVAKRMLAWRRQNRAACLDAQQIRSDNSSGGKGLIQMLFSGGQPWALDTELNMPVVSKFPEWYYAIACGFNLRETLFEAIGPAADWASVIGYRLRTEYNAHYARAPEPSAERVAKLFGANRTEIVDGVFGTILSRLFLYAEPRIYFRPLEQAVLRHALRGEDDKTIAENLSVSLVTIHKRWRSIYDRVEMQFPELLAPSADSERGSSGRGGEKRTHLLRYLQRHPEELAPSMPQKV